ncbi:G-protein coupled receptor 39 [Seriola lalandi dorsalis]|uniref:G protein-coupled receptor 39 n=1 Tax=Seriola lalandi dorsalis TaxID=1841481 RepID=A0A3B4XSJ2_SERLL|nr:G-protein coupled receptor 39 [Seriola lalandi dorsalis]XP_056245470.1 G-protein coupled receptor 39 [Seriola aureovittata]
MNGEMEIADEKDWSELEPNYPVKIFLTVFYSLILVTGIVGNSVTIRVTQVLNRNGYLQKNVTDHMVSLACSDLLVLLIGMPVELYSAIWFPFTSTSGNASCKIYNFLFEACSYATILNIATLSFERYVAICHPFRFKALGGKRTSALITFAWLVSVLVALPLLIATGTQGHIPFRADTPVQNLTFCTNLKERWVMYRVSLFVAFVVYLMVVICVAFMCRAMILVLRRPMGSPDGATGGTLREPKHESSKVKMARKQTIIFLGLIVGSLTVCWLPNQIRRLMMAAIPKSRWSTPYFRSYVKLHPVADTFFYLSSVINPFLYNLSSRQFREVFVQVLRCHLTIEHVNKRTLQKTNAASARSLRPLLIKSFRRSGAKRTTLPQEKAPPTFTTFQSDSGVASNTQTSLSLIEESHTVKIKTDEPSESEI